jgi:hypothetical protein
VIIGVRKSHEEEKPAADTAREPLLPFFSNPDFRPGYPLYEYAHVSR